MPISNTLIGKEIRKARKKLGLTQDQLAEKLELSSAHMSKIERGIKPISLKNLSKIADLSDIPIEVFVGSAYIPPQGDYNKQFGDVVKDCDPETVASMIDICEQIASIEHRIKSKSENKTSV